MAIVTQWNSATEDPPPVRQQFSINQSSAFVDSSFAAEDIVPWPPAGQRDGRIRGFKAELSR